MIHNQVAFGGGPSRITARDRAAYAETLRSMAAARRGSEAQQWAGAMLGADMSGVHTYPRDSATHGHVGGP